MAKLPERFATPRTLFLSRIIVRVIGSFKKKIAILCSQVTFWLVNSFPSGPVREVVLKQCYISYLLWTVHAFNTHYLTEDVQFSIAMPWIYRDLRCVCNLDPRLSFLSLLNNQWGKGVKTSDRGCCLNFRAPWTTNQRHASILEELRHQYGIFRVQSQTPLERGKNWMLQQSRLFHVRIIVVAVFFP